MSKLRIFTPSGRTAVTPPFTVSGDCDAGGGTPLDCTISKGAFAVTKRTTVNAENKWSIEMKPEDAIPPDTDYTIEARCPNGSEKVTEITVLQPIQRENE